MYRILLILSLLSILSTSSFSIQRYLTEQLKRPLYSQVQLSYGLSIGVIQAYKLSQEKLIYGSKEWRSKTLFLADTQGEAAWQLGDYYQHQKDYRSANVWFQQAISLNYFPAFDALAKLYQVEQKFDQAWQVLSAVDVAQHLSNSAFSNKVQLAVQLGNIEFLTNNYQRLNQYTQGRELLKKLYYYQVLKNDSPKHMPIKKCANSLQFFATNMADLAHVSALLRSIKHRLPANHFCFETPRYRSLVQLQCHTQGDGAIVCNEQRWFDIADTIHSRYVGVLLPKGGANVHYGMLYIDRQDDSNVLLHELSHLLGLVDEYPLPNHHAFCNIKQFNSSINVVSFPHTKQLIKPSRAKILARIPWRNHIKKTTPIMYRKNNYWLLGTPTSEKDTIGLYATNTCDENPSQAFKAINQGTKLSQNELAFPKLYDQLLTQYPQRYRMPSFAYNLAIAALIQGDHQRVSYWLQKALATEHNAQRRTKIINAEY